MSGAGRDVGDCDSESGSGDGRQPQETGPSTASRVQADMIKSGSVTDWMRYQVDIPPSTVLSSQLSPHIKTLLVLGRMISLGVSKCSYNF